MMQDGSGDEESMNQENRKGKSLDGLESAIKGMDSDVNQSSKKNKKSEHEDNKEAEGQHKGKEKKQQYGEIFGFENDGEQENKQQFLDNLEDDGDN